MDISNKIKELTQEILNFSDIINYTENPANTDFRNACNLFSQHLNFELNQINSNICFHDIRPEMQQTTATLYQLSELITPVESENENNYQWPGKLLDFCSQIQSLKNIAA